ncbi:MAG: hypothetical protein D3910_03870 [Candidatus Electrothrix sp. ATG2]|nr:hypothetical protein [Candidatus Electrothrix sp. ATG2]
MSKVYNVLCKRGENKKRQERIEEVLLELVTLSASLGLIGRLLIDADRCYDSVLIGNIIDHYNDLIADGLTELQGVLN